jgi:hypothetical protein
MEELHDQNWKAELAGMDWIIHDEPPAPFPETDLNMKRAEDVLTAVHQLDHFWPVSARSVYYRLISMPEYKKNHWKVWSKKSKHYGKHHPDLYARIFLDILKYLRLSGRLDMDAINDDNRRVTAKVGSSNVAGFVNSNLHSIFPHFRQCLAVNQERYIEVWTEKNGLLHILERVADQFCRRAVSCKGYQSLPMYRDYKVRAGQEMERGLRPTILYCGDYDPSGLSIPKTIYATLKYDFDIEVDLFRFALVPSQLSNLESVELKNGDKRAPRYIEETGCKVGWEIDAMHPHQLQQELRKALSHFTDMELLEQDEKVGDRVNRQLSDIESQFLPQIREACRSKGLIG